MSSDVGPSSGEKRKNVACDRCGKDLDAGISIANLEQHLKVHTHANAAELDAADISVYSSPAIRATEQLGNSLYNL